MSERITIAEDGNANSELNAKIATLGPLDEIDSYESVNDVKFNDLLDTARTLIDRSIVAAALVSAYDGEILDDPEDYGENITAALKTADKVRDIREFYRHHLLDNPDGDVGLHFDDYSMTLFRTTAMKFGMYYVDTPSSNAFMLLDAPLQTSLSMHGGHLDRSCSVSDHHRHEEGVYGNYRHLAVPFNEVQTGVSSKILQHTVGPRVDPLILGRDKIAQYFADQARKTSMEGGTTHRLSSMAYGLWRVREEDPQLAEAIDKTASAHGLVELWTDQYRQEIGSKAAHIVLNDQLGKTESDLPFGDLADLREYGFISDEPDLYGTDSELYLPAARHNASRIGVDTDDAALRRAVNSVFRDWS